MFVWYRYKTIKISKNTPKSNCPENRSGKFIVFSTFALILWWNIEKVSEHLGITLLTQKRIKNPKKSAITGYILLEIHNAT